MKIYDLDHAATTKLDTSVYEKMKPYLEASYGNPSSMHPIGIKAKKAINDAKKGIANFLKCDYKELVFTGSGTEAINLAIKGLAFKHPEKKEIITTKIEHKATLNACKFLESLGYKVTYLEVDEHGFIDVNDLKSVLSKETLLVSIIWGNNEIGVIQKLDEISQIVKQTEAFLHVDAVQMLGHFPIELNSLNVDLMSFSAHKIFGPKGIGLLYKKHTVTIEPLVHGGGQEFNLRAGTENVSGIIGFYEAVKNVYENYHFKQTELELKTKHLKVMIENVVKCHLNGPEIGQDRLPGLLSLGFPNVLGHELQFALSKEDIMVSTGSACNQSSIELSHVIKAITTKTDGVIRLSIGYDLTFEDIEHIAETIETIING